MSMWATVALSTAGALALVALAGWRWRRFRRDLRRKIAHESVVGHAGIRRRVAALVGRRQDEFKDVMEAETMRGWVWFYWTRRPREGYRERTGWAPTKRLAQRQLARAVERDTKR